jgi:hypothetical protein
MPPVRPLADGDAGLTTVELTWRAGEVEQWIRFGRAVQEAIVSRQVRRLAYAPDAIFALARWAANDVGTTLSRLDILRATHAGEAISTAPGVQPGGDSLLRLSGWPRVRAGLVAIDAVEALGLFPADAAPAYWRHVHQRLNAGLPCRPYAPLRHKAWRLRQGGRS